MAKVKITGNVRGYSIGSTTDFKKDEADRLVRLGVAEHVKETPKRTEPKKDAEDKDDK